VIFTHALFDAIVEGRKTVTRRPCQTKAGRRFNPPEVGDLLPLQRAYAKPTAWAIVRKVKRQDDFTVPFEFDDEEARREGFPDALVFRRAWLDIYGPDPVSVYRIEFELVAT
jgi:hypothetical protein